MMADADTKFFTRVLELKGMCGSLHLVQKEIGDSSCRVWNASVVLAKYLEKQSLQKENKEWLKGKIVVELGAGVGCAGLAAGCYGADVVMTDLPEVVSLLWANIDVNRFVWDANGGRVIAKELTWGKDSTSDWPTPDFIFITDCVCYEESLDPLLKTLQELAGKDTEILICQELRTSQDQLWVYFMKNLLKDNFYAQVIPSSELHSQSSLGGITLVSVRKR